MTKIRISKQFRYDPYLMAKFAQGGYELLNEVELPNDLFEFDIRSPKIHPDIEYVDAVFDTARKSIEIVDHRIFRGTSAKIAELCQHIQSATQGAISATEALHGLYSMKQRPEPLYYNPQFAFWGSKRMYRSHKKAKQTRNRLFKRV